MAVKRAFAYNLFYFIALVPTIASRRVSADRNIMYTPRGGEQQSGNCDEYTHGGGVRYLFLEVSYFFHSEEVKTQGRARDIAVA